MSFFGFDTTLPRDRGHPSSAPGFGQAQDPFAGLSGGGEDGEDDVYVFSTRAFYGETTDSYLFATALTLKTHTTG